MSEMVSQTMLYDIVMAVITGIVASLLTTYILKKLDKHKAKMVLLQNFRFMESMEESHMFARAFLESASPILKYFGDVKWFHFPGKVNSGKKTLYWQDKQCQKDLASFCIRNKYILDTMIGLIKFEKNDVIYDTINKSLGISYSQKLCNIADHLKSRAHNFIDNRSSHNIDKILGDNDAHAMYYVIFDILAYISHLFDLYAFLGIESRLNTDYDISSKMVKKR